MEGVKAHLAAQLQTIIRMHLRRYDIDAQHLARLTDHEVWAVESMLQQPRWNLALCLQLLDQLHITVAVTDASDV